MHNYKKITIYSFLAIGNTDYTALSLLMRILSKQTRNTETELCLSNYISTMLDG